jgi:hypothetical protein
MHRLDVVVSYRDTLESRERVSLRTGVQPRLLLEQRQHRFVLQR